MINSDQFIAIMISKMIYMLFTSRNSEKKHGWFLRPKTTHAEK